MRWWRALRQSYPNRSALTVAVVTLFFVVLIGGGIAAGGMVGVHMTSTEQFCVHCHELRDNAQAEFKDTIHDKNRTGIHVECADCHLPKELVPMMIRKVEAAREVWGHMTGKIDTKEKYNKHRYEMAVVEWTRMKKNNSQECRNCHDFSNMDPEKQSEKARERHAKAKAERTDCIDCHFGIAHNEPDGPGPKELKIAR
jgi:cytochrome c-type protein NapC